MIGENGFILENQLELPFLGLDASALQSESAFSAAIDAGYRHFLLAPNGENTSAIRKILQSGTLPKQELLLSMEMDMMQDAAHLSQETERILREMDAPYLDLLLLRRGAGDIAENWAQMELLYEIGAARSIGVSGFLPQHLLPLLRKTKTAPMANLLSFSPEHPAAITVAFCLSRGIQIIGKLPQVPSPSVYAEKYAKTPLQLCTRLALQQNILPLIQTKNTAEMRAAQDVFDFEMEPEDFYALLTSGERKA